MRKKPTTLALSIITLQFMTWLNAAVFIIMLGLYIYGGSVNPDAGLLALAMLGQFGMAIAGLFFAALFHFTANGLLNQKKWARVTTLVLGVIFLVGFPVGTIIGVLFIYGVTKGWPVDAYAETDRSKEPANNP